MKREVAIWYPAHNRAGGGTFVAKMASGHILLHGVLLCGQDQKEIIKKAMADKGSTKQGVIPGNPMCPRCTVLWKERPESGWEKWTGNSATNGQKGE